MTVGEQIRAARLLQQVTVEELAEKAQTSVGNISRWENNKGMTLHSLQSICKALNIRIVVE